MDTFITEIFIHFGKPAHEHVMQFVSSVLFNLVFNSPKIFYDLNSDQIKIKIANSYNQLLNSLDESISNLIQPEYIFLNNEANKYMFAASMHNHKSSVYINYNTDIFIQII